MRPNIFDIAPKELNQDAFITWLLKFADNKFKPIDELLNECGKAFIYELIKKQLPDFNEQIIKVKAGRQWEDIDVWAEINDKYLIIIEDKTDTFQHTNQLKRYKAFAEKWCSTNNYEPPICIYLKTGNESQNSLKSIVKEGFAIFNRFDFISLLDKYNTIQNNIFLDFLERLTRIEKSNKEFENKFISEWDGSDWQGFFQFLENEIKILDWYKVNNPNGGFWNLVLTWDDWGVFPAYMQIEEGKLCFKISTDPDESGMPENISRSEMRNQLHHLIVTKAKEFGFKHIRRPDRFGSGKYMTVAIVDRENWLGADTAKIDKESVVNQLTSYMQFLTGILEQERLIAENAQIE